MPLPRQAIEQQSAGRRRACSVLGVDRSSVRYCSVRPDDTELRQAMKQVAAERRRFGYPKNSPIRTMASTHKPKGGAVAWTDAEVEKFLTRHGPGTMARLWFCLADCTAGRIGDTPHFGKANITYIDGEMAITWQPSKPGSKRVTVLVTEMLRIELENHDIDRDVFLLTAHGRPFRSSGSLDNRVRKWIVQAGITDKNGKATRSQHGIRKGVAELLASSGATEYEIMTTLGHSDPRTSRTYTEKTERIGLGVSASLKRRMAR